MNGFEGRAAGQNVFHFARAMRGKVIPSHELIACDERGDGVLFVERSSELLVMASLSHLAEAQ